MFKRFLSAAAAVGVLAAVAHACTIPVYRYALERWELTPYDVVVYHDAPLDAEAKALVQSVAQGPPAANVRVETVDVRKEIPKFFRPMFEKHGANRPRPWVAVRLGDAESKDPPAWIGSLSELKQVVASPARSKVVDRLKVGETAVFVVVESGDETLDSKARALLTRELARLEKAIELPEQSEEGPQLRTGLPLKVAFSIHSISRTDPAEREFIKILLATEEDLETVKGPIAFPIFGRGRALCSLFGEDLSSKQITNVARFLCSECSCQVKELNPGVDLLIPADWRDLLEKAGPPANPRPDTPASMKRKGN